MNELTDEELAKQLKRLAPVAIPRGPLLEAAADRLCALSAHNALLKASLAQAEREAEKSAAIAEPVCETCGGTGMIGGHRGQTPEQYEEWEEPCPECSASAERCDCCGYLVTQTEHRGCLSASPARVAEMEAEVERLRGALSRLLVSDPDGAIANATDDELREAVGDEKADPVVREQAASLLQARAALAGKEAQS